MADVCCSAVTIHRRRVNILWFALIVLTFGIAGLAPSSSSLFLSAASLPISQLTSSRDLQDFDATPSAFFYDTRHRMKRSGISDMRLAELEALIQLAKANRDTIGKRMDWRMSGITPLWQPKDETASFL